jgi:hypothetical protein
MKRNIQLLNTDLTLAQFEDLISTGAEPRRAGRVDSPNSTPPMAIKADSAEMPTAPTPISPSALPFGGDTEGEEILPGKQSSPSLFLIDVRPEMQRDLRRARWIEGFLVGGLFIALLWVCAFLIIPWLARHL